jgi:hypothetical protein
MNQPHARRTVRTVVMTLAALAVPPALAGEGDPGTPPAPAERDVVRIRIALLEELDRGIADRAAQAHLDARRMLDDVLPVPYLGIDAEAVPGGMRVTKVFPATGAEEAGLRVDDVVVSVAGVPTPSAETLAHAIRRQTVGDRLAVEVRLGDATRTSSVRLGRRPEEDEDVEEQFPGAVTRPATSKDALRASFDADPAAAFDFLLGGHGAAGEWRVTTEGPAAFLRQSQPDATGIRFPLAVAKGFHAPDVAARVRFRLASGAQDRAAGLVLRFEDRANYLVARVNAVESDLRIFRVVHGLRRTLPGAKVPAQVDDGAWHVLEFRAEGPRLSARVDGGQEAVSYDTFLRGGGVGLWTKSDSVSDFDDLECVPIVPPALPANR